VAKKSALNAIKKIDKQLNELNKNKTVDEKEKVPVIQKRDLDSAAIKSIQKKNDNSSKENGIKKKNGNSSKGNGTKKKSNYYERQQKRYRQASSCKTTNKTFINKKSGTTKNNKKVSEATAKLNQLEDKIRDLYSKDNEALDDAIKEKVVIDTKDVLVSDVVVPTEKETKLDKISMSFLNKLLIVVTLLFTILFVGFIGFLIFITTF